MQSYNMILAAEAAQEGTVGIVSERADAVAREVEQVIVGKTDVVRLVLAALLCNGHVLVEDIPGVGKTTLAKTIAKVIGCTFKRVQFTPDLLPSDVTGASVFSQKTEEFEFRPGPVFANVVLADEINRATPKTQSSLLECMEEQQVTVDGATHHMPQPFFVIATQNNIERQSTFPLPEAQLDRFLMRITVGYPGKADEAVMLENQLGQHPIGAVRAILGPDELLSLQRVVKDVHIDLCLREYIVNLVTRTRQRPEAELGASPRGSIGLLNASRALAALDGRDYVLPDDVRVIAVPVLAHRIIIKSEAVFRGMSADKLVTEVLGEVPVPVSYEH